MEDLMLTSGAGLFLIILVLFFLLFRKVSGEIVSLRQELLLLSQLSERAERAVGVELGRNREETLLALRQAREEMAGTLKGVGDTLYGHFDTLTRTTEQKLTLLREVVERRLGTIQEDNARQLERMRETVDEKLQGTLEKRLGESFKQVGERLEQVSRGLGEMQSLAAGVGDLKRALTNVKVRGTWGEVQLGAMLEQALAPNQYSANVATKGGGERVEFAIRLPGQSADKNEIVWLPIDAKFPLEDYQRLVDAQQEGNAEAAEAAGKQLESSVRRCAADIAGKYLNPPQTTDFAIMFLPTEGLFAEVIRRGGLVEQLQREFRVAIAGPTTLWGLLSSLQAGFRTLAIQQRSAEVWRLLAAVKTEWSKYGEILSRVQKKIHEASETIEQAQTRSRAIGRKLKDVEVMPTADATDLLLDDAEEKNQ
ncbi:MAG: DNA recombination protein RmuC [Syntrophobacterales bacterium]|nr:DNA recombination protein RmuC [Syntrophobacterales bacterium]